MKLKRNTKSRFVDKCSGCFNKNNCISPTAIVSSKRKYLLKVCGHRQVANEQMLAGTHKHEDLLSEYPKLKELGYTKFKEMLFKGKRLMIQELVICSPSQGFRGVIDLFGIKYNKDSIEIIIIDLKPRYNPKYIQQIIAYGMILADRNCLIAYDTYTKRTKKLKRVSKPLYPKKSFDLNIEIGIDYYLYGKPVRIPFMLNNVTTEFCQGVSMSIVKKANNQRLMHKQGLYFLENTKPCEDCKKNEEYCNLWEICHKLKYVPNSKESARFFGKKQLLVKSKPKPF